MIAFCRYTLVLVQVSMLVTTGLATAAGVQQTSPNEDTRRLALGGFCPVAIMEQRKWVRGSDEISHVFDNRTYWFADEESREKFLQQPLNYVPVLGGDCSVCLVDVQRRIPGSVFYSTFHNDRLFLFPTSETKQTFKDSPDRYTDCDLAFGGDCAVSRHAGRDERGNPEFTAIYNDMRYRFSSQENLLLFSSSPEKFAVSQ